MCALTTDILESMIRSFLGPCKGNKVVTDGKDFHIVRCPHQLLQETITQDPFNFVIEDTLECHHESYGCSTTTLLAMWYFWKEEFQLLLHEGYEVSDIVSHSQDILDIIVSHLHQITLDLRTLIFPVEPIKPNCQFPPGKKSADCVSRKLCYSSRHYSPVNTNEKDEAIEKENLFKDVLKNQVLKSRIHSIVDKLSHDDSEIVELVCDLWLQQIASTQEIKFCSEGVIVCPLTLPSSYSTILEGCIIKSKLLSWYDQETKLENKSLIIKGSLTHEYVHLGGNSKVITRIVKKPDEVTVTKRDVWLEKCFNLLKKMNIDVLLVHGAVDDDIACFCLSNSICLLSHIPWPVLEILCLATKTSPCEYLLDCNEKNILSDLIINIWKPTHHLTSVDDKFVQVRLAPSLRTLNFYTVVLCHPNQSYLECLEHQFMHLVSRLNLVSKSNKLLPGGGKTEEWCCNLIKRFAVGDGIKAKIGSAISNGYHKYFDFVNKKIELRGRLSEAYDEMESKIQAWRSALCMVIMALQSDKILINDPDNLVSKTDLYSYL